MGLFGKDPKKTPQEQVREWTSKMRKQSMLLDRQIRGIQREELKVKAELKKAAKNGDKDVCYLLAKEIVNSRKAVSGLLLTSILKILFIFNFLFLGISTTHIQSTTEFSHNAHATATINATSGRRHGKVCIINEINAQPHEGNNLRSST